MSQLVQDLLAYMQAIISCVLENLIGNAVKYRRNGEPPDNHVSAERIGVDDRYNERIFGIFKRESALYCGSIFHFTCPVMV